MFKLSHPQRFAISLRPGVLLKRIVATRNTIRRQEAGDRDPDYLARIRQCPCLYCSVEPAGQAAHVRRQSGVHNKRGGMGKKPADKWALPLCFEHHMLQHRLGELQFWHDAGIDPLRVCVELYQRRTDFVAMRALALGFIADHTAPIEPASIMPGQCGST